MPLAVGKFEGEFEGEIERLVLNTASWRVDLVWQLAKHFLMLPQHEDLHMAVLAKFFRLPVCSC